MILPRSFLLTVLLAAGVPLVATAQGGGGQGFQQREQQRLHMPSDDDGTGTPIYGYPLMTPDEIAAHRARMQAATPAERASIRAEHHRQMVERARERGITLPDQPPMRGGKGPGGGKGQGPGKNAGQGAGPGAGPGAGQSPPQSGN
ncbi:hypothetical protein AAG565_06440 [Fontimonas sp. SYSU GA230001]|uniref:hypothetical protein n=1 Tax=Fontimonas sp. SYSU GA230001 TaxID=3142450 RepID=UPI0032B5F0A1